MWNSQTLNCTINCHSENESKNIFCMIKAYMQSNVTRYTDICKGEEVFNQQWKQNPLSCIYKAAVNLLTSRQPYIFQYLKELEPQNIPICPGEQVNISRSKHTTDTLKTVGEPIDLTVYLSLSQANVTIYCCCFPRGCVK